MLEKMTERSGTNTKQSIEMQITSHAAGISAALR
jgi:hypothetical protein